MSWLQISFHTNSEHCELLEQALLNNGAESVTLEDDANEPLLEPGLGETPIWGATKITGLFSLKRSPQQIIDAIDNDLQGPLPAYHYEFLEDKYWQKEWMQYYEPIAFGRRLWICPSWIDPPDKNAINLMLDPGLAFGTGSHETTALCLNWLDAADLKDKTIIDYGCGSGILAIAALLLGAKHVFAIDYDDQALVASKANAEQNQISTTQLTILKPNALDCDVIVDIVIANILSNTLIELKHELIRPLKTNGDLIMSGILTSQEEQVITQYSKWVNFDQPAKKADWVRLTGKRRQQVNST